MVRLDLQLETNRKAGPRFAANSAFQSNNRQTITYFNVLLGAGGTGQLCLFQAIQSNDLFFTRVPFMPSRFTDTDDTPDSLAGIQPRMNDYHDS